MTKTDFDKKKNWQALIEKPPQNKTKYLEVQKELNSLITKDYIFSLGRIYFTSNSGSQKMFVYQRTFDTLELKKD